MAIKFSNLEKVSLSVLAQAFNQAFATYFVPIHLTPEILAQKILQEDIKLDISVGVFAEDRLVGFILHGLRNLANNKIVYNGGTGVIAEFRGQQLTQKMYAYVMPLLKQQEVNEIRLEVIAENANAIKIYERLGFKMLRKLNCWKQDGEIISPTLDFEIDFRISDNADWDALTNLGDYTPAWQYDHRSLQNLGDTQQIICVYHQETLIGYAIVNRSTGRIGQIAVKNSWRRKGVGATIIYHLSANFPTPLSFINAPNKDNTFDEFLTALRFKLTIQQNEMSWKIA